MSNHDLVSILATTLSLPSDSPAQLEALNQLSIILVADSAKLIANYSTLTAIILDPTGSVQSVQRWAANLVENLLSRAVLSAEIKTTLALLSLDTTIALISSSDLVIKKIGLQCFASLYPLLFKNACAKMDRESWTKICALKEMAIGIWRTGSTGGKIAAVKVVQRIIITQTAGSADPRLQRTAEPNLLLCRPNHLFLVPAELEDEAKKLREECITALFTSPHPDIVCALMATLTALLKVRPASGNLIVLALCNWTPAALARSSDIQIKGVEKTIRIALTHLVKTGHTNAYIPQITEFFTHQGARMELAESTAAHRKEAEASRKRQLISDEVEMSAKRRRIHNEDGASFRNAVLAAGDNNPLAGFDAKTLPLELVVELVIASFEALSDQRMFQVITTTRNNLPRAMTVKDEAPDPLKSDLEEDELEMKLEAEPVVEIEEEEIRDPEAQVERFTFDTVPDSALILEPLEITATARDLMLESTVRRICSTGIEVNAPAMWVPLVIRLITRGLGRGEEEEDSREKLRGVLFDFVVADHQSRIEFARIWLNEEWYVDKSVKRFGKDRPYDKWLRQLMEHIMPHSRNKDKFFAGFIIDLPEIPCEIVERLGEMCMNPDQVQIGFQALRELAVLRPTVRDEAVDVLLSLTTHSGKLTRNAAIMTVKRWVPETEPLSAVVLSFALTLFTRLEMAPAPVLVKAEVKDEDGEKQSSPEPVLLASHAEVQGGRVVGGLLPPTTLSQVVQHVELLLALCYKSPELIDHLFESYERLQPFVQDSLQALVAPMIRSLGPTHPKLVEMIENSSNGSEKLVLKLVAILEEKVGLSEVIVDAVKEMGRRREQSGAVVDPRFWPSILGECDKAEVKMYLAKILSLLDGTPANKVIVRSVFDRILTPSPQSALSSVPKIPLASSLSPVELLMLLHSEEYEIGLKSRIEAIAICFSLTAIFPPPVLAAFMQVVVEEPVLPTLFLRTVIQAATTYKSLQPFISTTLFSRLISKRIWETGSLWEGFIRCAKVIAPLSFGALVQLPSEKLREVVEKQEGLREGLKAFILKGNTSLNTDELLAAIGESEENAGVHSMSLD